MPMRLLPCPSCKTKISWQARNCPKCGHPLVSNWATSAQKRENTKNVVALLLIGGSLIFTSIAFNWPMDFRPSEERARAAAARQARNEERQRCGERVLAFVAAEGFIKERLKAPGTAQFASITDSVIWRVECGRWGVKSYVDAHNSFGALIRTHYDAVVSTSGDNRWKLESVQFEK
jgi:hypothetical protein